MNGTTFLSLARPHFDALFRFARRLTRSHADAEDLAQTALLKAFEYRETLRDEGRIKPWLLRTARNLHLNRIRDERPHLVLLDGSRPGEGTAAEPQGNLEEELHERALPDELALALASLPEDQSSALWLREVEGLSYEEIAEVQQCPIGTVRSRLARARGALLEHLQSAPSIPRVRGGAA